MPEPTDLQRELTVLAADLKRLEAEYTMFFAGRSPRPPWETRRRVETLLRQWGRGETPGTADRFRFEALQSRFQSLVELWDRALRAKEEGRPGPLVPSEPAGAAAAPRKREVVHVTAFTDPAREVDKLRALYDNLMGARKDNGGDVVPFHKFAALVSTQVTKLRETGSREVAFRVSVKDGKVNFTVRGLKGGKTGGGA